MIQSIRTAVIRGLTTGVQLEMIADELNEPKLAGVDRGGNSKPSALYTKYLTGLRLY
jgi:hypothetical protein